MLAFNRTLQKEQTGVAMVEFAIILPFLLLLVLGIIEFGYAFYHFNILNKSVQDGARYFSHPLKARKGNTNDPIDVTTTVSAATNGENIERTIRLIIYGNTAGTGDPLMPDATNYTSPYYLYCEGPDEPAQNYNKICEDTTQHIRVTAIYQHNFIMGCALQGILDIFFGGTDILCRYPLTASSVLRVE